MPELSRFYGIIIRMCTEIGASHHQAHFHASYQSDVAIFGINPVGRLAAFIEPLR